MKSIFSSMPVLIGMLALIFFNDKEASADNRPANFDCSAQSEFAVKLITDGMMGLVRIKKKGISTLGEQGNQLYCKMIVATNNNLITGLNPLEPVDFILTLLDEGQVFVEIPIESASKFLRFLHTPARTEFGRTIPFYNPPVNTYTHRPQGYMENN
jgi:hypothetical protein